MFDLCVISVCVIFVKKFASEQWREVGIMLSVRSCTLTYMIFSNKLVNDVLYTFLAKGCFMSHHIFCVFYPGFINYSSLSDR